jgi:leader peptidase (prepilin peptidase)/N-methyltransferase
MADDTGGLEQVVFWYVVLLGACLGSFVNVLIVRLPEARSVVRPASACPRCGNPLAWHDNIPIFSYLLLRGRCRHCQGGIAPRYLVIEVLMAALGAAFFVRFGMSWDLVIWLPLAAALLAITYLDIDHWWVPDVITWPAMAFVAAASFLPGGLTPAQALLGLLPAGGLLAVAWAFERITKRQGLGLGDVKLLALLGLALGPMGGLTVLLLAAVQGSLVGSIVMLTGGHRGADEQEVAADSADDSDWVPPAHAIPFGPFLALGALELVLLPGLFDDLHLRFAGLALRLFG